MQTIRQLLRYAIIFAICSAVMLAFAFIAFASFNLIENAIAKTIVILVVAVLGFIATREVFRLIVSRGIIEFLTVKYASPELDNLKLDNNSHVKALTVSEFLQYCQTQAGLQGGRIKLFGDHKKRGLSNNHRFKRIARTHDGLVFDFQSGARLEVSHPSPIQVCEAFIKIQEAEVVNWNWERQNIRAVYQQVDEKVTVESTDDDVSAYDALSYHPAVFIYS